MTVLAVGCVAVNSTPWWGQSLKHRWPPPLAPFGLRHYVPSLSCMLSGSPLPPPPPASSAGCCRLAHMAPGGNSSLVCKPSAMLFQRPFSFCTTKNNRILKKKEAEKQKTSDELILNRFCALPLRDTISEISSVTYRRHENDDQSHDREFGLAHAKLKNKQPKGIRWSYLLDKRHEDVKEVNLVSSAQRHIDVDQLDGVWFGNPQRIRQTVAEL